MDRTALFGFAAALAVLCPIAAGAQTPPPAAGAGPLVAHAVGDTPRFGFLAGPSKSDVAWSTNGDELAQRVELQDPAVHISEGLAADIAKRKGGHVGYPAAGQTADYTVKVETTKWSAGYFVPDRPTYNVEYDAQVTVTNSTGGVVKTATCQVTPDDRSSAGSNDEFVAHKGRTLKTMMGKAADDCLRTMVSKTKGL
jgi:hypothetical protein